MSWQIIAITMIVLNMIILAGWGHTLAKSMGRSLEMYALGLRDGKKSTKRKR